MPALSHGEIITYLETSGGGLAASYRYDPFGNLAASSGALAATNVYRFSSKEVHLNTGMYYYLCRQRSRWRYGRAGAPPSANSCP